MNQGALQAWSTVARKNREMWQIEITAGSSNSNTKKHSMKHSWYHTYLIVIIMAILKHKLHIITSYIMHNHVVIQILGVRKHCKNNQFWQHLNHT